MMDPYQVLGISPSATDDEVKKAYRELSRKYHPDSYVDNPLAGLAEEKFKEVQEAYSQIMNARENGQSGQSQSGQGQQYGGFGGQNANGPFAGGQSTNGQGGYNSYQNYGNAYGRNPSNYTGSGCGTGNLCCDLWCADSLCECMGGDLCDCM